MSKVSQQQQSSRDSCLRCINRMLDLTITEDSSEKFIQRIIVYIKNVDFQMLTFVLKRIFDELSKSQNSPETKAKLANLANKLIDTFHTFNQFRPITCALLNYYKQLPIHQLEQLGKIQCLILLALSNIPRFSEQTTEFISKHLVDGLKDFDFGKLDHKVIYEISRLKIPNFNVMGSNAQIETSLLSFCTPTNEKSPVISLSIATPSLYDAVIESDPRSLITLTQLDRLFSFFPTFDASYAASCLTAVSSSACSFRQFFNTLEEMQRERVVSLFFDSFGKRDVNPQEIVYHLDQPGLCPLDREGCALLLNFLSTISKDQPIDGSPFLGKWRNVESQAQFLIYISSESCNVAFKESKCRMVPQSAANSAHVDATSVPNRCWLCVDFVERFYELSGIFPATVQPYLSTNVNKFGPSILLSIALSKIESTPQYSKFASDLFGSTLNTQSPEYFETLWDLAPQFCSFVIISNAHSSPQKLTKIAETFSKHLGDLLASDDLLFSIDLAFSSAMRGAIRIDSYIGDLVKRHGYSVLPTVLKFVKERVLDTSQPFMNAFCNPLNTMFEWFSMRITDLPLDIRLMVNSVFFICESNITGIKHQNFADSLPQIPAPDPKRYIADTFAAFFRDSMSLQNFLMLFHQLHSNSAALFQSMVHYLLLELHFMESHDPKVAEKLGLLVGSMVRENLFQEQQLHAIFTAFQQTFTEDANHSLLAFSSAALNICYSRLTRLPIFVFGLLKQPAFQQHDPVLYQKMKKISMSLSAPIQLSQTTKLKIHPKIRRFEKLEPPPPKLCKLVQTDRMDTSHIGTTIISFTGHMEWLALHVVEIIEDHPVKLQELLKEITSKPNFCDLVIQAAAFEAYNLIEKTDELATYEGGFKRRRMSILGRLVGALTLARNRPLLSRYIDLKHILLYALAKGKLFGVIPFVGAILRSATSFFNPPNPYTSGVLQILASINSIDLLKLSIKNQISLIMSHFEVKSSQFVLIPLIPNLKENNFDFIVAPFSLSYVMTPTEIERIISLDETAFYSLTSQHFIIPECSDAKKHDKFRNSLTNATLTFLKNEGQTLAKYAASTAAEIVIKDFLFSNDTQLMYQTADTLTKQLSAGLAMFTFFQKQQLYLHHQVMHDFKPEDNEWVSLGVQLNHNWIGQLLKDFIHLKAWKIVQQRIEQNEDQKKNLHNSRQLDGMKQKVSKLLPHDLLPTEAGLEPTHQRIYQDLADLPLSPAQISYMDTPGEKSIKSLEVFDKYFANIHKVIASETSSGADKISENINIDLHIKGMPELDGTFENFASALRTMMKSMFKTNNSTNDMVFGRLLEHIVSVAQPGYPTRVQPFVVSWLRNFIPSVALLCVFLKVGLLTTKQLDRFFFDSLNRQPFNGRLFNFAMRFLTHTLIDQNILEPAEMIDSLSFVVSTPPALLEQQQLQQLQLDKLQHILDSMDVPINVLSPNSKLQTVSLFDPLEDMSEEEVSRITGALGSWKELIETFSNDVNLIMERTEQCVRAGKPFFVILFFSEKTEIIAKFIHCVQYAGLLDSAFDGAIGALELVINGNGSVVGYDMRKYYDVTLRLMTAVFDTPMLVRVAAMLHTLRPLLTPAFTFAWVQLVTEKHFVHFLVTRVPEVMRVIVEDYISAVIYSQTAQSKDAFDFFYRSLLRFILVLIHDFPDFVAASAPEIVSFISPQFTQLRNIILSTTPAPIVDADAHCDEFSPLEQPLPELVKELDFEGALEREDGRQLTQILEKKLAAGITELTSYIVFLSNTLLPQMSVSSLDDIGSTKIFKAVARLINGGKGELVVSTIHVLFDQLRAPSRATSVFARILEHIYESPQCVSLPRADEHVFTIAMERISTPAPHPWGLVEVLKAFLDKSESKAFIKASKITMDFVAAVASTINPDKDKDKA